MSGLIESLSSAARAMQAQSLGIETTGHNMANLNTPGYTRRLVQLAEVPPTSGGGVRILVTTAARDALIDARLRRELPAAALEAAVADGLSVVESSMGRPGASLDRNLSAFFDAWQALSREPASMTVRDNVVQQGRDLARAFGELATRLDQSVREADLQIRAGVERINVLTADVASFNAAIARGGASVEAMHDQLGKTLDELSGLVPISVLRQRDGTIDVSLESGRALVVGERAVALTSVDESSGTTSIHLGDTDVTVAFTGGRLAGALQLRDVWVPGYQDQLDQLAFDVATAVNDLHASGRDLNGDAGEAFFTPPTGVAGAARRLAVAPALADPSRVVSSATGSAGDNQVASALAGLRDALASGGSTFADAWGRLVYRVGSDSATVQARRNTRQEVADAVARLKDSVSGVSLDEEAASLIKYQRAYEANARFFSAVGETLDVLLRII